MSSDHSHGPGDTGTGAGTAGEAHLEEVAPSVFAYVQPDGGWFLNNMGFFVPGDGGGVLSIDMAATAARTRSYLAAIGRAGGNGIRTLVSTHHHGDHTNGNSVAPSATIVGHELCRQAMLEAGTILRLDALGLIEPVDWGDIELAPPFVTFSDRLTCYSGDLRIELYHFGTPAHTTNDVVAFVPEHRVLFSGDLTFHGVTPFFAMGSGTGLLAALEHVRALDPAVIVPGHGEVCGPEVLDPIEAYVRFVQTCARDGLASGVSPLEVARQTDLGPFGELVDPERFVGNLHREYAELGGLEPGGSIDLVAMFRDMVTMNNGQPLHCVA